MSTPVVHRIALLGAESTGKSTLAEALARRHGSLWVPEYLREFVETTGRVPEEEEQIAIARTQLLRENQASATLLARPLAADSPGLGRSPDDDAGSVAGTAVHWLFCDTTPLMTALYSMFYFKRVDAPLAALAARRSYRHTIVTAPDAPWVADGLQRESETVRQLVHEGLLAELARLKIAYTLVAGNLEERLAQVQQVLAGSSDSAGTAGLATPDHGA